MSLVKIVAKTVLILIITGGLITGLAQESHASTKVGDGRETIRYPTTQ